MKKVIQEAMETISIHAPARGATILTHVRPDRIFYFNPRSREGSDWMADSYKHKPKDFNPRSREGSDRIRTALIIWISYFNPRSREGSDVEAFRYGFPISDFNPRSREGSDKTI